MSPSPAEKFVALLVAQEETGMELLQTAAETLDAFGVGWERRQIMPGVVEFPAPATGGRRAIIVASPDAVLPEWCARASGLPTLRVPVAGHGKAGLQLLTDAQGQLPAASEDEPFATMAIGAAGAKNAALFVVAALAVGDEALCKKWLAFRAAQTTAVLDGPSPALAE